MPKVLVIKLDGVGDVVMAGPFLRELRRASPNGFVTLVVGPQAMNLVETCPYVDRVLSLRLPPEGPWWHLISRRLSALSFARRHLWQERYDVALVPRWGKDRYEGAILAYLSGARRRKGFADPLASRERKWTHDRLFTELVSEKSVKHEVRRNLELIRGSGTRISDDKLEVWLSDEDLSFAREVLGSGDTGSLIALGLGAGAAKRIWPIDRFVEVGRWITDQGFRLVAIGGRGEEGLGHELGKHLGDRVIDMTGKTSLRQTAAVLRHASLFCGNDAGPMHLAAAVGIPVIEVSCHSLQGDSLHPNSPERFGPWGVPQRIVRPEEPIDGCTSGCNVGVAHCILKVDVTSVLVAVESLMHETAVLGGSFDAS